MRIAAEFEIKRVGDKAVLTIASGEFEKLGAAAEAAKPKISSLAGLIQSELNGSLQGMSGRAGSAGTVMAAMGPQALVATGGLGDLVSKMGDVAKAMQAGEGHFSIFRKSITSFAGSKVGEILWRNLVERFPEIPQRLNTVASAFASFAGNASQSLRGLGDRAIASFSSITAGASLSLGGIRQTFGAVGESLLSFGRSIPLSAMAAFTVAATGLAVAATAVAAGVGLMVAGFGALIPFLISATKETIAYADKIGTLQERTDLSGKTLQILDSIARKSGTSLDTAAKGVANMQAAIVKGDPAFKSLGLSFLELRKLPPEEALAKVAKSIDNIGDAAGRTAARRDVFGRMGDDLGPLLSTLARGTGDVDRFGLALSDAAWKGAKALGDNTTDLGTIWGQFTRQLGDTVVQTGLAQDGVEFLTGALGKLAQWVRDNKDDIAAFFKTIWNNADQAAEAILRAIPGIGAARAAAQAGRASRTWDETTMGVAPGQWVPGPPIPPPPPKSTYISPEEAKRQAEAAKKLLEAALKLDQTAAAHTLEAMRREEELLKAINRFEEQANSITARNLEAEAARFGSPEFLGSYGIPSIPGGGPVPAGRVFGKESMLAGTKPEIEGGIFKARAETVNWNQALGNLAHTMQLLGGEANGLTKALGVAIGGLAAAQQVADIMGKRSFGQLKGSEKLAVGAAGLGVAAGAYQGGSVLGGAAGGAAFGMQVGGPWGAAIGAVAGGALGWLGKAAKERKELEALRTDLTATYGSMDQIRKLGAAVGVSMDVAFNTKSPKAAKAAIEQFEKALAKTKGELTEWEKGIVSAQARALVLAQSGDQDVQGFVRGQREAGLGGLGAGVKGIKLATVEDARAQAAIVAVNFWDTFKTEGFIRAADAFKDIMATVQASLAKIGGDEAAAAILGPIQQLVDLGTVSESFRGAAEGAQGLATNLDSLTNRSIPLTAAQFGAFGQQASSAFEQAKAAAIETGMSAAEAQNAAIMASAPLLQSLVQASQAYGFELSADTQQMLAMAEASGLAFKTDSTDRLILAINALTTTMGGVPPTFDEMGASATRASDTSVAAAQRTATSTSASAAEASAAISGTVSTTAEGLMAMNEAAAAQAAGMAEMATGASTTMADVLTAGTLQATGTISQVWGATTTGVMSDFSATTMQMEAVWKGTEGMMVTSFIETLPSALEVYLQELDRIPTEIITNAKFSGTVPEPTPLAGGAMNRYFGARPGGHWLNVSEGGRGEYVTVTHSPVTMGLGGLGVTGLRVPRGVTHAQEGLFNITDVLAAWNSAPSSLNLVDAIAAWGGGGGGDEILDQVLASQQQTAQNIASLTAAMQTLSESGGGASFRTGDVQVNVGTLRANRADEVERVEQDLAAAVRKGNGPLVRALEARYGKALTGRR